MPDHKTGTVYVIAGPTAVGKTDVAAKLALRLGTSVISADSRQCYREMNIGTAKPPAALLKKVKHYFIDEFPVSQLLSAADFEKLALGYLSEIFTTNNTAVVCGGTGLYIKALCDGLDEMPETDKTIELQTEAAYRLHGLEWLQHAVQQEDPEFYETGEIQNPARLLRALSFFRSAGASILSYRNNTPKERPFKIIKTGLELPRQLLYQHINTRTDRMMGDGLLEEVKRLEPFKGLKNMQTVGYTELFDHLEGKYSLDEAIDKIKQHTRNYAKRQLTWFKKDTSITWFRADDENVVSKILLLQ